MAARAETIQDPQRRRSASQMYSQEVPRHNGNGRRNGNGAHPNGHNGEVGEQIIDGMQTVASACSDGVNEDVHRAALAKEVQGIASFGGCHNAKENPQTHEYDEITVTIIDPETNEQNELTINRNDTETQANLLSYDPEYAKLFEYYGFLPASNPETQSPNAQAPEVTAPSSNGHRGPKVRDLYKPLDKFVRETQAQGYTVTVERLDAPCEPCSIEDIKNAVQAFRDQYAGDINEITIEYVSDADTGEITIIARHLKDTNIPDQLVARYRVVTLPIGAQETTTNPQEVATAPNAVSETEVQSQEVSEPEEVLDVPEGEPFTMERLRCIPTSGLAEIRYAVAQKKGKQQGVVSLLEGRANTEQYLGWLAGTYDVDLSNPAQPLVWRVVDRSGREYELLIPVTNNGETTYMTIAIKVNVKTLAGLKYSPDIVLNPDQLSVYGYVDSTLKRATDPILDGYAKVASVESGQFAHDAIDFYTKEVASYRAYLNGSPFEAAKAVDCLGTEFMIPACLLETASDGDIRVYALAVYEYTVSRLRTIVLGFIQGELNKRRETLVMNGNQAVMDALDARLSQAFPGWENHIPSIRQNGLWKGTVRHLVDREKKQQLLLSVESAYVPFVPELPSDPHEQMLVLHSALDTFHASMNALERQGQQREFTQHCQRIEKDLVVLVELVLDPKNGVRDTLRQQFFDQWTDEKTGIVRVDLAKLAKDQNLRFLLTRGLSEVLRSEAAYAALNGVPAQKGRGFSRNGKHPEVGVPTLVERIHEYLDPTSEISLDATGARMEAEREKDVLPLPDDLRYAVMAANKELSGNQRLQNLSSFGALVDQCLTIQKAIKPKEGQIEQIAKLFKHPMFARARTLAVTRGKQKEEGALYGKEMITALEKNLATTLGEHTYRHLVSQDPTLVTGVYTSLVEAQMHNLELAIALQEEVEASIGTLTKSGGRKRQRQAMPIVIAMPQKDEYLEDLVARFAQLDLVRLEEFLNTDKKTQGKGKGKGKGQSQKSLSFGDGYVDPYGMLNSDEQGESEEEGMILSQAEMQVLRELAIKNGNPIVMLIMQSLSATNGRVDQLNEDMQKIIFDILDKHEQEKKQGRNKRNRNRS